MGNSRGELRPVVRAALDAGLPLTLHGDGWADLVDPALVAGVHVPNDALGPLYASAGVVLGDHWDDMRTLGFVSNRTFDVLATGARLLSDDVAGLSDLYADLFDQPVPTWRDPAGPPATGRARLARGLPRRRRAVPGRRAGGRRALVRRAGRPAPRRGPHGCRPTDLDSSP